MSLRTFLGTTGLYVSGLGCTTGAFFGVAAGQAQAQASLEDCGNIYVEAEATCEVTAPSVSCDVQCEPIHLQAACAGEAYVDCRGGCDVEVDVQVVASCEAQCDIDCKADPGEFNCQAYCQGSCSGDCSASCASSGDKTRCEASCRATCTGDCDAECKIRPPTVDCSGNCKAACTGSAHARASVDCQVDCQSEFYLECEADLSGGCKADCMSEQGALFCDGNYVDTGNNLEMCIDALKSRLDVQVEGYADGECVGNTCTGEVGGSGSCSALPGGAPRSAGGLGLSLLAGLGLVFARRRRSK